ncbi:MAG: copper amine oxidase N-terminal domain-containing protein [Vulcanimicrobiota bacterium]
MKKNYILPVALALFLTMTLQYSFAVGIVLDGKKLKLDTQPVLSNGMIFVPLRGIFEKMGAKVKYDKPTRTITATKPGTRIILVQKSLWAKVNGAKKRLIHAPFERNSRTYVPLRFLSETLGCRVGWDPFSKTVAISTDPAKDPLADLEADTDFDSFDTKFDKIDSIDKKIDSVKKINKNKESEKRDRVKIKDNEVELDPEEDVTID